MDIPPPSRKKSNDFSELFNRPKRSQNAPRFFPTFPEKYGHFFLPRKKLMNKEIFISKNSWGRLHAPDRLSTFSKNSILTEIWNFHQLLRTINGAVKSFGGFRFTIIHTLIHRQTIATLLTRTMFCWTCRNFISFVKNLKFHAEDSTICTRIRRSRFSPKFKNS